MPSPSSTVQSRPDLAAGLESFDLAADRAGFIGHNVLPIFECSTAFGEFGKIPLEDLLTNRETLRAPRTGYARGDWTFVPESFRTQEHGAEEPIDDAEGALYKDWFEIEIISAQRALDVVLRNAERRIAAAVFNESTFSGDLTSPVEVPWDNVEGALPIDDINRVRLAIWAESGIWPNSAVMSYRTFLNLREADQVQDRIISGGAGESVIPARINRAKIAELFDLPNIFIAGSAKNTANEGQAAEIASIWSDDYVMICRTATTNDLREPCIGRTFHWDADGSVPGGTVEIYREEGIRGDVVRVRHQVGEKIIHAATAHLLTGLTTPPE